MCETDGRQFLFQSFGISRFTETDKTKIVELYNHAIENYNKYLVKQPEAQDKEKIEEQINYLNKQIKNYNTTRNTNLDTGNIESVSQTQDKE